VVLVAVALGAIGVVAWRQQRDPDDAVPGGEGGYLLCFWNVENLFDDQQEDHPLRADRDVDSWLAHNPQVLQEKLGKLSEALLKLNGGRGPDILACAEVESLRAAELLQKALNDRLRDPALHYSHVLFKEVKVGRHIAPAILTRLPVAGNRTRLLGRGMRILEAHIIVNGHDLIVIASHWTSRLKGTGEVGRDKYANQIYGEFKAAYLSDPNVDLLVCGDFNDTPHDESVIRHLHAAADPKEVLGRGGDPRLLNLFADKAPATFGTHYYEGKWHIFDQILVSPGLLDDRGWTCDPATTHTVNNLTRPGDRLHRPWRFGSSHEHGERGYSDHFPVTVRLRVQ
jgi:endonuclease/exonuclease/phosphatase family metal-dependent hydrolase